jgi:glycosyltransferase involved in cell wall biosynthesis
MHIWFVSIFENTPIDDNQNTRYNSLANEAVKRGHSVTFWASTFKHNVKKQRFDDDEIVRVNDRLTLRFLKSKPYQKNISLRRLYSHHDFASRLVTEFDKMDEKPDRILIAFPPISLAEKVSEWAVNNGIPCLVDIIDPWPDVFSDHLSLLPGFLLSPLRTGVKKTMQRVSAVASISNQYVDWAKSYHPGIPNSACFYPAIQFRVMQKELEEASEKVKKIPETFTVIYAGSLGHSYDISTILKAAGILEEQFGNRIRFIIAGDGPQKEKVEAYQKIHQNLEYVGRVAKKKLMEYYYLADLGMTQHIKGATQSVTYKLFDLLACGLPVLNSLESEMKDIILENRVGLHNKPGDSQKLADNIQFLYENHSEFLEMKSNAVKLTKQYGDSEKVYAEAIDFIESLSPERVNPMPA